jgi:hypothetical protein
MEFGDQATASLGCERRDGCPDFRLVVHRGTESLTASLSGAAPRVHAGMPGKRQARRETLSDRTVDDVEYDRDRTGRLFQCGRSGAERTSSVT